MMGNLSNNPMPRMPIKARLTVEAVMREHHVHVEDFYSLYRDRHLVAARGAAAERLLDIGYMPGRIALFLRRNRTTVLNYLPQHKETRKTRHAAKTILRHLTPEARVTVLDYAHAENVKPELLIAQWVNERASYEAQAKLRAAA
jgi:hypothetical protein